MNESHIFCKWKSDSLVKKSESLPLLFCHEQREGIAYGSSFVKSHRSNSLTVTIFKKATGGICSRRSLKKSDWAKSDGSDLLLGIKRGESCEKLLEHMKNTVFYSESLVFWERFAQITRESLMSLFLKEIKSDSLMVTLL